LRGAMMAAKIGYARASAVDPDIDAQEEALRNAGCEKVYVERPNRVTVMRDGAIEAVPPFGELVVTRIVSTGRGISPLLGFQNSPLWRGW
jgi:hypothetical protein